MNKKILLLALLLLAAAVFYLLRSPGGNPENQNLATGQPEVQHVDLVQASSMDEKLPPGFPSDIPLENGSITQSYKVSYKDRNTVQFSLSYATSKTRSQKYNEYLKFMTEEGFDFGASGKSPERHTLYGIKGSNDLVVIINEINGRTVVDITYLERS